MFTVALVAALLPVPEPRVADNAATYYSLAADHVHNLWSYEKDELEKVLAVPFDAPPHPDLGKWLEKFDRALVYLHRGANCRACVWLHTASYTTSPIGTLSGDALNLSRVYALALRRTQVRFTAGRTVEAVSDIRAVLRLTHFQQHGGSVGAWMGGNVAEWQASECVATILGDLPPAAAAILRGVWQTLPPAAPAEAVVAGEWRALRSWLHRTLDAGPSPAADGYLEYATDPPIEPLAVLLRTTPRADFARMDATAARWADRDRELTTASPAVLAGLAEQRRRDSANNKYTDDTVTHALMKTLGPNAAGLRRAEFRNIARRAMIVAALDARAADRPPRAGVDAFGHTYRPWPLAGGYVLVSDATYEDGRRFRLPVRTAPLHR